MSRRRWLALAALLVAASVVAAIVLADSGDGRGAPPTSGVPAGDTTTMVTRRTLTESSTVSGTLGYGATLELYDHLAGTYTWLPSVGATIACGGALFRVNNLPVVLMYGSVPAYRTLEQGVSEGPDVAELNENLIDLGYDPYGEIAASSDSRFGAATAAAVRRWQHADGLPGTGEVALGRVVFAPSARRVTAVHVTLGQDPPPSEESSPGKGNGSPTSKSPSSKHPSSEESAGAATAVLATTSTEQLVQLKLKAEQQQLARVGERAPVTLPGGEIVQGRVVEVGTVASEAKGGEDEKGGGGSPGEGGSESATIPVTLVLAHRAPRLDQSPVNVELVKSVRHDVLTVPATALLATAGGGYAVEVLASSGRRRLQESVTPGMFANGYVQVEAGDLREGQTVIESE